MSMTTKNNCDNDNDLAKMMIMTTKNGYDNSDDCDSPDDKQN